MNVRICGTALLELGGIEGAQPRGRLALRKGPERARVKEDDDGPDSSGLMFVTFVRGAPTI